MIQANEMKPTKSTLFWRGFVLYQFIRFIALMTKILKTAMFPPHEKHDEVVAKRTE